MARETRLRLGGRRPSNPPRGAKPRPGYVHVRSWGRRGRGVDGASLLTAVSHSSLLGKDWTRSQAPRLTRHGNAAGILDVVKGTNERKVLRFLFFFLLRGSATLGPNPARRIDFPPDEFATCSRRKYDFGH